MRSTREKIWMALYSILAKNLPQSRYSKIAKTSRRFYAKRVLEYMGKGCNIERGAVFNGKVSLGDKSGIGINCELNGSVKIGKFVNMGPEVVVYTRNHAFDRTDIPMQSQGYGEYKEVTIGDDVWIGRRVIILPGVTVGEGSIIGAGSVVTKDVPPYCIAAGNPAKIIRKRKDA